MSEEDEDAKKYPVSVLRERIDRLGCVKDVLIECIKDAQNSLTRYAAEIDDLDRQIVALDEAIHKLRGKESGT